MTLILSIALAITLILYLVQRKRTEKVQTESRAALQEIEKSVEAETQALKAEAERIREHYQAEADRIYSEMSEALGEANARLEQYVSLAALGETETEIRQALEDALEEARALQSEARQMLEATKEEAAAERTVALLKAREIREKAEAILARAATREREIIDEAHQKAEDIAGDAYTALREKDHLEEAIKGIRNVIDGYGDRYVKPTHSLLDDLASDFGHTEAGQALTTTRERVRVMVDEGLAAECDYAEAKRKGTAVRFVIDAFNGRVDAILSRVKHDNYGTLEQEIKDTFNLVNLNGEAFRNARIRPEFLEARLTELKWAVVLQELKLQEREEQRQIREQIREEQKARREYERAIKEAQKEEALIRKALEKARAEVESASAEERARFEQEVAELNQKLEEAEAKNQRALSMAQQTRKGNVYIISNIGSFGEQVVKIGMTRRLEPLDRVKELGDASVPFSFDVHAIIPSDDAPALENEMHRVFDDLRLNQVNRRKEFFRVDLNRVREFVRERGIDASFTMAAEAHEYRESQAMVSMSSEERMKYRLSNQDASSILVTAGDDESDDEDFSDAD